MPRVTIICNSFPPETGGAPGRIYRLAKLLQQGGYEVQVITAMPNYPLGAIFPAYRGKLVVNEEVEGIRVKRILVYPSNDKKLLPRALSMMSHVLSLWVLAFPGLLLRRADLAIVSSPPLLAAHSGMLLARLTSKKVLLNVSDLWPLSAVEMGALNKGWRYRLLLQIEKSMYRLADGFMGQSKEILQHIRQLSKKKKPEWLYRNLQEGLNNTAAPATAAANTEKKIIYAGLLGHAQGVLDICRALDFAACGVRLFIYGNGPERKALEMLATRHPEKGIVICEPLPPAQLSPQLHQFDATLIPLKYAIAGAVPSKLFLAIAHQLPVLFCAGGEGEELVQEHGLGWVSPPGDHAALLVNIRRMVAQDEAAGTEMRQRLATAASSSFNARQQGRDFLAFLNHFLQGHAGI